eukprot:643236-Pelagomonas_calceolata.AAC.3
MRGCAVVLQPVCDALQRQVEAKQMVLTLQHIMYRSRLPKELSGSDQGCARGAAVCGQQDGVDCAPRLIQRQAYAFDIANT